MTEVGRRRRARVALAIVSAVGVAVGLIVAATSWSARPVAPEVAFSASHVEVSLAVTTSVGGRVLEARFVPDTAGIHLYGPDLPATGIDGAGRPTRVEVVGGGWAAADSGLRVEPTPYPTLLPGFSAPFSVEPAGPVTLRLGLAPADGDRSAVRVSLTYLACTSDGRCYPPVVGQELDVPVR